MKQTAIRFQEEMIKRIKNVTSGQEEEIEKAAHIIADTIEKGGIVQAQGCGHSHMIAMEVCGRAGGFIQTKIINEPSKGLYERVEGVGSTFVAQLDLRKEDTLIMISNSGRNPFGIEVAMEVKKMGIPLIVVTAYDVACHSTSRHSSGKMLHEFADVILDNHSIVGDSCIEVEGLPVKVGGSSSYAGSMLLDCVMLDAMDILLEKGITPPVFMSANVDGGAEYNQKYLDLFKDRLLPY